jgi:hypothetical protein
MLPSKNIATSTINVSFTVGIYYVMSLTGSTLTIRGWDGSTASTMGAFGASDPVHTYIGAMVYSNSTTSIRLYPKLMLNLPSPVVGANGVVQGAQYSIRLAYGEGISQYDIINLTQTALATNISVPSPKLTDGSRPLVGDLYFGSFFGESSQMTSVVRPRISHYCRLTTTGSKLQRNHDLKCPGQWCPKLSAADHQ